MFNILKKWIPVGLRVLVEQIILSVANLSFKNDNSFRESRGEVQ